MKPDYDVIVMGGGPAGSCVSTLLAQQGRRVLVVEKERFPRHHIGESLIPETYWPLKRMGVLDKIRQAGFTKKFSVQFASNDGRFSRPFYFFETNHHESAVTWQVLRSKFDALMLDHARESGAEVRQGTLVQDVLFDGERAVGVEIREAGDGARGPVERLSAHVLVDATGLNALLSSRLGLRLRDPKLRKAVVYSYFRGARRDPGVDHGATLVLRTPPGSNGWFWFIPLAEDVTSVGIVADPDYLFGGRGRDLEKIFAEEIERCAAVRSRVEHATRVDRHYTIQDYSFRSRRCSGPGYVMIGDAYGFLDPIYSTGVFLALKSAELAADAIERAFRAEDFSGETLGAHEPRLRRGVESFRKLVYAYYASDFSFGNFIAEHPECRANLIDLLVGNIFREGVDDIFEVMKDYCDIPPPLEFPPAPAAASSLAGK